MCRPPFSRFTRFQSPHPFLNLIIFIVYEKDCKTYRIGPNEHCSKGY